MGELKLVIFDVDGTLVDSQAMIVDGFREAFSAVGRSAPAREAVLAHVGLSLPEAVARLLPDAPTTEQVQIVEGYRAHYLRMRAEQGAATVRLFEGARETVEALAARPEVLIGAATGMAMRGLNYVLDVHGWARTFVTRQTADLHPSKPHPSMIEAALAETGVAAGRAVMVGDTTYDMEMAANAGIAGIGVSWGHHAAEALRAAGAIRVVDRFQDLPAALDEIWETR